MRKCLICQEEMQYDFSHIAANTYSFQMLFCRNCGFLKVENPTWLDEVYRDPIAIYDTGLVRRNIFLSGRLTPLLFYLFGTNGRYVDFAGGTGLFVRLMRDAGHDFYWWDPYCTNIHAHGFNFERGTPYCTVTAFEVLEHLDDPVKFVSDAFEETGSDAFFFTTELFSGSPPKPDEWWYYAFSSGQHISFYQLKTLEKIADKLKMMFLSKDGIHVYCKSHLFRRLHRYYNSSFIRRLCSYKSARLLKSKTMADHLFLLGKGQF